MRTAGLLSSLGVLAAKGAKVQQATRDKPEQVANTPWILGKYIFIKLFLSHPHS